MTNKPEIFAVIWNDFIPLSLHCASAQEAIDKARGMVARGTANGLDMARMAVRAVHVPAGTVELVVLERA